jgi:hypothetical protein
MPTRKRSPPATRRRALDCSPEAAMAYPRRSCSRTDFRSSYLSSWFMPGSPRQALNARSPADTRSRLPACGSRTPVGEHSQDALSRDWNDDDYDVLADGVVVGRIFHAAASPVGSPWMWTLIFDYHEGRSPTHGYEATREAAMAAFTRSWRRK